MRVSGVELKNKKRVLIALTYIYGIGYNRSLLICEKANIELSKRVKDLTNEEGAKINQIIEEDFTVEGELKRELINNFRSRLQMKHVKAWRTWAGLPSNGQRTHTNAKNSRKSIYVGGKNV